MDWFKYLKRSGTPLKFGNRQGGYSISWRYKFDFPFLRPEGYTPDLQIQIFENGFDSPITGVGVGPLELRLMVLTVPQKVGYNVATGIILPPPDPQIDKTALWSLVPKVELSRFLDEHRGKVYSCFMKAIFEHKLEK